MHATSLQIAPDTSIEGLKIASHGYSTKKEGKARVWNK
jgi:hypothetical protein